MNAEATERGYQISRQLIAAHGRTYHLATRLLPRANRRAVYALYGYARLVDDIVDQGTADPVTTLAHLDAVTDAARREINGLPPDTSALVSETESNVIAALGDTVRTWRIDPHYFTAFARSMRMDAPGSSEFRNRYRTFDELADYTYGSASVIGLQLLPVLGVDDCAAGSPTAAAAAALGEAFQLTNFIRDVGEDLDRDRIYLPTEELAAFGVDEDQLRTARVNRQTTPELRRAVAHLIACNRSIYRSAAPGIALLPNRIRASIAAAATSYEQILQIVESPDFNVMATRAVVPKHRRIGHAVAALVRGPIT